MNKNRPGAKDAPRYTKKDLETSAIRKAVFSEAAQHPATIFPFVIAVAGGLFGGLMPGVNSQLAGQALAVAFVSGVVSTCSLVYNYFFRSDSLAKSHVGKVKAALQEQHQQELEDLERELTQLVRSFREIDFDAGAKQGRELWQAYTKLVEFLEGQQGDSAARYILLAKDTLRQGISILRSVLEFQNILAKVNVDGIEIEKRQCEKGLEILRKTKNPTGVVAAEIKTEETRLAGFNRSLQLFEERQVRLQNLMTESENLENALVAAYLEVIDIVHDSTVLDRGSAAQQLTNAITAAKRVEQALRGAGTNLPEDEIYLKAGQRK